MISFKRRQIVAGIGAAFATGIIPSAARAAMGPNDTVVGGVAFGAPYQSPFSVR